MTTETANGAADNKKVASTSETAEGGSNKQVARKPRTPAERLAANELRLARAAARVKSLKAAQEDAEKKLANHRKYILGGWLLDNDHQAVAAIVPKFKRAQDRAAFEGWKPEVSKED